MALSSHNPETWHNIAAILPVASMAPGKHASSFLSSAVATKMTIYAEWRFQSATSIARTLLCIVILSFSLLPAALAQSLPPIDRACIHPPQKMPASPIAEAIDAQAKSIATVDPDLLSTDFRKAIEDYKIKPKIPNRESEVRYFVYKTCISIYTNDRLSILEKSKRLDALNLVLQQLAFEGRIKRWNH